MSTEFEQRKNDHLNHALDLKNQATGLSALDQIHLEHDSLPDFNFSDISIESSLFDQPIKTPFYISGMTAGHENAKQINLRLASAAASRGWIFGVGSQRREFENKNYSDETINHLSKQFPQIKIISNLGIAQVIEAYQNNHLAAVVNLAESIKACLIAIHLNPLQEAIQAEGTPNFQGSFEALFELIKISAIPVVIKETGCGMSMGTLNKIKTLAPFAVDVSGLGGTHWGRIEGARASRDSITSGVSETFKNWGISTLESMLNANAVLNHSQTEVWASGGVRSGLDAAKLISLGARRVGFAMPALQAALQGEAALDQWMTRIENELKTALFCTNSKSLIDLSIEKMRGI